MTEELERQRSEIDRGIKEREDRVRDTERGDRRRSERVSER